MARQPRLVLELAEEWADHREDALASLGAAA
jgi:hypothetical protein